MEFSLDQIETGSSIKPPIIVAYGPPGIGKTTLAAAAPGQIVVQCEDGAGKMAYARCPVSKTFDEVMGWFKFIYQNPGEYKTVALDNLSRLELIIHDEIRKTKGEDIFADYGKGFKMVGPYVERLIRALSALRDDRGMMILILAHSKVTKHEPPDAESYDRYELDCHESMSKIIYKWCDAVLFMNYKTMVKKEDAGFGQKRGRGIGTGQRVMYTEERPTHIAKNRYDLEYEWPIEKPFDWAALLTAAIGTEKL